MPTRKWGSEKLVNTTLTGTQWLSSVAGLIGGGFVVVWEDRSGVDAVICGQRYDASGARVGGEIDISGPTFQLGSQIAPSVVGLADGGFYVSWSDTDAPTDRDIVGAVFSSSGAFVRSQDAVGDFNDSNASAAARLGTGSVVAFMHPDANQTGIFFRIFDAAGNAGSLLQANTTTAGSQQEPAVAAAPSGNRFAIVWHTNEDFTVRGRLFTAAGTEAAPEFIVASSSSFVTDAKVTWLNNGNFAVTWREYNTINDDNQIYVKIYDGSGGTAIPLSAYILVNSTLFNSQQSPTIAALPSGGFVIAWEDWSGAAGDADTAIRLQAFDGSGSKIGGEMLVNTTTGHTQRFPSVSALADGRVVVSWTDFSAGNDNIRMQIVDPRDGIVMGSSGIDTLFGHDNVGDEISGYAGADTLYGLKGDDSIYGGDGNDIADGGIGNDTLYGGADNDTLAGGLGDDELFGEDANDTLRGGAGADLLDGGASTADMADYLTVTSGGVTAALDASLAGTGEALGDTFVGVERLRGTNFNDTLRGDGGVNLLFGQNGADNLDGRGGADRLFGGLGIDTLTGNTGADRFEFAALTEIGDNILDFTAVDDTIVVTGAAFGGGLVAGALGAALFQSSATNVAANATVRFIFENDVKILWFDADGNGAGAAVMVADLQASATMTNADILIV